MSCRPSGRLGGGTESATVGEQAATVCNGGANARLNRGSGHRSCREDITTTTPKELDQKPAPTELEALDPDRQAKPADVDTGERSSPLSPSSYDC